MRMMTIDMYTFTTVVRIIQLISTKGIYIYVQICYIELTVARSKTIEAKRAKECYSQN